MRTFRYDFKGKMFVHVPDRIKDVTFSALHGENVTGQVSFEVGSNEFSVHELDARNPFDRQWMHNGLVYGDEIDSFGAKTSFLTKVKKRMGGK